MIIRAQILQNSELHIFTASEFLMYLVGLTAGGCKPLLHISSSRTADVSKDFDANFDYDVIIELRN